MKRLLVIFAILAMAVNASTAIAGNVGNVEGQNGVGIGFDSSQATNVTTGPTTVTVTDANTSNNSLVGNTAATSGASGVGNASSDFTYTDESMSLGSLPQATTHSVELPIVPMNDYGHQIDQYSLYKSIQFLSVLTYNDFKTFEKKLSASGKSWKKINSKIKVDPGVVRSYARLADNAPVWFPTPEEYKKIQSSIPIQGTVGIHLYDTEFEKWDRVVPTYIQMKALQDGVANGCNMLVLSDQFRDARFLPDSWGGAIAGVVSGVADGFLRGQGGAANLAYSRGQNMSKGNAGGAFACIHVDNLASYMKLARQTELTATPKTEVKPEMKKSEPSCDRNKIWSEIKGLEKKYCPNLGIENMNRHLDAADKDIEMYLCTGNKSFLGQSYTVEETGETYLGAIGHFKRAEMNFRHLKGGEREAAKVKMDEAYDKWATSIRTTQNEKAQDDFIRDKKLTKKSKGFSVK